MANISLKTETTSRGLFSKSLLKFGTFCPQELFISAIRNGGDTIMNSIIYLVGLVVIVLFILSFLGLR
ncbi:hypothetical protein F9L00_24490 [Brucella anthropi]|uniref:Uncharacterized protein n=1 Tax=Brucella tritici TaxID=94626 RepID=A0A7V7VQ43_9HYPH|nr:hypothetical protein F9K94_24215 [Brucella tritici]KAB2754871.1 hypothetical protein F9K98_25140 [Brucella anthropi]KAB2773694.1 hypothetical protein F9L00_24490 [Brucella anthropi]